MKKEAYGKLEEKLMESAENTLKAYMNAKSELRTAKEIAQLEEKLFMIGLCMTLFRSFKDIVITLEQMHERLSKMKDKIVKAIDEAAEKIKKEAL